MDMTEKYPAFGKIPRWYRDITITEKIDGTNGLISINEFPDGTTTIAAGSRNRWLTPEKDNCGFYNWVMNNQAALMWTLGPGLHYGEWWGSGIQRRYGLTGEDKRFSLFNTHRWKGLDGTQVPGLFCVPILHQGPSHEEYILHWMDDLFNNGSHAQPGFMKPEGIIIFHGASRHLYKVTLENDSEPKGKVNDRAA